MTSIGMDWLSFWSMFEQTVDAERKAYVEEQIKGSDFDEFMRSRSVPILQEILSGAPITVAEEYISLLPEKAALKIAAQYPTSMHARLEYAQSHPSSPELFHTIERLQDESVVDFWRRAIKEAGGDVTGDYARIEVGKDRVAPFEFQRKLRELAGSQGNPILSARLWNKPAERIFYVGSDLGDKVAYYKPRKA